MARTNAPLTGYSTVYINRLGSPFKRFRPAATGRVRLPDYLDHGIDEVEYVYRAWHWVGQMSEHRMSKFLKP
jgi:hypothetical protein